MVPSALRGKYIQRLQHLLDEAEALKATIVHHEGQTTYSENWATQKTVPHKHPDYKTFDHSHCIRWMTNCATVLGQIVPCGNPNHSLIQQFREAQLAIPDNVACFAARLQAFKDDFEHGFLDDALLLVRAEVAADYMEQASQLMKDGYTVPAAVLAGTVLEDVLRKMCADRQIPVITDKGKSKTIEPLNVDLQQNGAYNAAKAAEIRGWAALRNQAAHGQGATLENGAVCRMLEGVQAFVGDHMR